MTANGEPVDEPWMELALALPAHWDVSPAGIKNPATWALIKLLKLLAYYPHLNQTYFSQYDTIPLGEDWAPMTAAFLMPPVLIPELAAPLAIAQGHIQVMALYLLR